MLGNNQLPLSDQTEGGVSEISTNNISANVSKKCDRLIDYEVTRYNVHQELQQDFLEKTGLDINGLHVSSIPINFQNSQEFINSIHKVTILLQTKVLQRSGQNGISPGTSLWNVSDLDIESLEGNEAYIYGVFTGKNPPIAKRIVNIEDDLLYYLFDYLYAEETSIEKYLDMLEGRSKKGTIIEGLSTLIGEIDRLSYYLIRIDPHYQKGVGPEESNSPINMPSHTMDYILDMMLEKESYIHYFDSKLIHKDLKILELRTIIINYLNHNIGEKSKNLRESTLLLAAFAYLMELLQAGREGIKEVKEKKIFSNMIGKNVSQSLVRKFMDSHLKKGVLDVVKIPVSRIKKIIQMALLSPDIFLSEEDLRIEKLALAIAGIEDEKRIDRLSSLLNNRSLDASLEQPEIIVLLQYGIEDLPYVQNLDRAMILWIFYYFSDDSKTIASNVNIKILHDITFEDFLLLISISQDTLGEDTPDSESHVLMTGENITCVDIDKDFPSHRLSLAISSLEGCNTVLNYERLTAQTRKQADLIPVSFKEIRIQIEAIIGQDAFRKNTLELENHIKNLDCNPEYITLTQGHNKILAEVPQAEQSQILAQIHRLYDNLQGGDLGERLGAIQEIFTLPKEKRTLFCGYIQDQNITGMNIAGISSNIFHQYVDYVISNDFGSDLLMAYEYFLESQESSQGISIDTKTNSQFLQEELVEIFGKKTGDEIFYLRYSEEIMEEIILAGELLDENMRQMFAIVLLDNKNLTQKILTKLVKAYVEKISLCRMSYVFLQEQGLLPIRNPINFFKFLLLGNHTEESIQYMIYSLENEIDSSSQHSEARDCIMGYLKKSDKSIILEFIQKEEEDLNFIPQESITTKSRKKKKTPASHVKTKLSLNKKRDRDVRVKISRLIDNPTDFINEAIIVINKQELYHIDIYAYILYTICQSGITFPKNELIKLSKLLKNSKDVISGRGILQLGECLQSDIFYDFVEHSMLIETVLYIFSHQFKQSKYKFTPRQLSHFIAHLGFMQEYEGSKELIELLLRENDIQNLNLSPRAFDRMLFGLLFYRDSSIVKSNLKNLFENAPDISQINEITAISLTQQYSLHGVSMPDDLKQKYNGAKKAKEHRFGSRFEKKLFSIVQDYYPYARHGEFVDGFECDIIIDEEDKMIEADGKKYHSGSKKRKNKLRDDYFENREEINGKKSYSVDRVVSDAENLYKDLLEILTSMREI